MRVLLYSTLSCCISGTNQVQKSGTDVLLDLLSIGTPPAQSSSTSTVEVLPSSQDNKSSLDLLDSLSSPTVPPAQVSSRTSSVGSSPMMDLLDGISTSPSTPGTLSSLLQRSLAD